MIFTDVLIRSLDELRKTNVQIRHALVKESKSDKKGTYPVVYQYLGKRNSYSKTHEIHKDSVIGEMTNIHQDETSGNILCDVTIYDVKQYSCNFNYKIDNIVVHITDGEELIVNGVVYNSYAKSVIDEKKRQNNSFGHIEKMDRTPIPDDIANDKILNPLFVPEVRESIDRALENELKGENGYDD